MIILNKKRILFLTLSFIFSICFYNISNLENNNNTNNNILSINKNNISATSSIPAANHTIILDAGHGAPDGGAVSTDGKIIEADLNLNIVLKLQKLLEASNTTVILTRSDENGIYEETADNIRKKKVSDMKNRVKISKDSNAEIFISIHMNKLKEAQYKGWQTFYKSDDEKSKNLANSIQNNLNYFIDSNNKRSIKSIDKIYLSKNVELPLVIVECGFLSNTEEANLLNTEAYQDKLAWCIYSGILDYFN